MFPRLWLNIPMLELPKIYLASGSPRRRELLAQIGVEFDVLPVEVPEVVAAGESAVDYVRRVALDKARAGWLSPGRVDLRPVLGADTEVVIDGEVQGKPRDRDHGLAMLEKISGRCHEVLSAVAVVMDGREEIAISASKVCFAPMTPEQREDYWDSGEPLGKAGGYAVQGLAAAWIRELHGSFSGVMGLPLFETFSLLSRFYKT